MGETRILLSDYFDILEENRTAKFLQCNDVPVTFNNKNSTDNLWKFHDKSLNNFNLSDVRPNQSLLDLKIELAKRIFENCHFCERRCSINRNKKAGNCGVKQPGVTSEFLHIGEERVLVPSHTIFFSGCTFHCVFCQNWDISQVSSGIYIEPEKLVDIIHRRNQQSSRNVNWVGGDPTPNLYYILTVLKKLDDNIAQIWNSNMYCSTETMNLLNRVVDLYLTDFKYGTDKCAKRLSLIDNYFDVVKRNHIIAHENGNMIIRHLVMPNHVECCSKPIMKFISDNLPNACVNIMAQYRPEYHAKEFDDISRYVQMEEVIEVKDYVNDLKIHLI
jgi:putative pyruvate formate lyase activating enzyme